jgi:hypothetical protein
MARSSTFTPFSSLSIFLASAEFSLCTRAFHTSRCPADNQKQSCCECPLRSDPTRCFRSNGLEGTLQSILAFCHL